MSFAVHRKKEKISVFVSRSIGLIVLFLFVYSLSVQINASKKITDEHKGRILALLQLDYSQRQIVKILKYDGINVSQRTVSNVKRKIGLQRNSVEDPPTQREIVRTCRVNQSTISRIIKSANFVLHKKCKVHKLTSLNVEKRYSSILPITSQPSLQKINDGLKID